MNMKHNKVNSFDSCYPKKINESRKYVKELKRSSGIYAIAHFDLIGSTKKMKKDQARTITEMLTHNKICRSLIKENNGIVIKELGDAVLVTFLNTPKACQCALNVIHNFKKYGKGILTKVTITAGTIEKIKTTNEPDVYGVPVNLCTRMSKYARKNSIIVENKRSEDIKSWLPRDKRIKFSPPENVEVNDFGDIEILKISLKE